MDRGPWTTPMDRVHGPPHGPGPWNRSMYDPYFSKGNRPCQFYMKIYRRSGYEKHRLLFIAYILEGLSRKSVLFWDRGPMNGKTTNSFWDTEDLVHFYHQYFHSNTFKLQFDQEDTPSPCLLYSIAHKNKLIYFINKVYLRTQIYNEGILMKKYESVFFIPWPRVNFHINRGDFLLKIAVIGVEPAVNYSFV